MRVELRLELDNHEHAVTIETDRGTDPLKTIGLAVSTMRDLVPIDEPF